MKERLLICLGLVVLTWGVYWQTLDFGFIQIDDHIYVSDNPRVQTGLTAENIDSAFTTVHFLNWVPLTLLSFMLDAEIHGLDPGGYHLTNLLLHSANVLLLFLLLHELTGAVWRSAFVAALFGVRPLHVESVAWISERKDVLSIFFGLICLWAYNRYGRQKQWKWYLLALAAFAGSLLSKQTLVTLPFLLLLLDYWPLGRLPWSNHAEIDLEERSLPTKSGLRQWPWGRLLLEKVPFFGLTALFCAVAFHTQRVEKLTTLFGETLSFPARCANAVVAYFLYIKKTFWPTDLAIFHPHPGESIPAWQVAGAASFMTVIRVVAVLYSHSREHFREECE